MHSKVILAFFVFLLLYKSDAQSITASAAGSATEIPVSTSGYGRYLYKRVYFLPMQTGPINVALKLKSSKDCRLRVQLGLTGQTYLTNVKRSGDYVIVPVGNYNIDSIAYHFISIQEMSTVPGRFYPDITSVIVSGDAAKDIKFNSSEYKGAPATHLAYPIPADSTAAWFYTEIKVPQNAQSMNAYYMTNGFSTGYMGIQVNSPTERRVLFSIWSDYKTDDPNEIPEEYKVKLVRKGYDVHSGEFGNEGSGGQTYFKFNWKAETIYKLLITATAKDDHTIFAGYFYAPETGKWKLIGEWDKPKTKGALLTGLYSFVENFGDNGEDCFKAWYGNQWIKTPSGNWIELNKARFSTTADPAKHPRFDYGGGAEKNWFYMFSGGFGKAFASKKGDVYERAENKMPPVIIGLP